jgi:hypothetical protein
MFIPDPDLDILPIPDPGAEKAPDPGIRIRNIARYLNKIRPMVSLIFFTLKACDCTYFYKQNVYYLHDCNIWTLICYHFNYLF